MTMQGRQLDDVAQSFLTTVQERKDIGGVDLLGLPTGFTIVDMYTGGLQDDQVTIVAAVTSCGKTAFGLDIALSAARYRPSETVLFYSLEMSAEVLVNRLLSSMADVDASRIVRGKINDDEWNLVQQSAEELSDLNLQVIDSTATIKGITEHGCALAETTDISLVVIDYLQLLKDGSDKPETERVGEISRNVRNLARPDYLNIPVVALSQLNRSSQTSEDKVPQIHQLKNSSNLEQDAGIVLLLHRPAMAAQMKGAAVQEVEHDAMIIIGKNREGQTGATEASFTPRLTKWAQ